MSHHFEFQPKMGQQEQINFFQECFKKCCSLACHHLFPFNVQPLLLTATQGSIFGVEGVSGGSKEGNSSWHPAPIGGVKSSCDPLA